MIAPSPPPVTVTASIAECKEPSFVITFEEGIPVIVALIKLSSWSFSVPLISSPTLKVPKILSEFKTNSETLEVPIKKIVTLSTIAVAFEVEPVIVLPTKSEVLPVGLIALKILFVVNLPSETRNICSRG